MSIASSVYTRNMESKLKDLLKTSRLSKIPLAAALQLIAKMTMSWDEDLRSKIINRPKIYRENIIKVSTKENNIRKALLTSKGTTIDKL